MRGKIFILLLLSIICASITKAQTANERIAELISNQQYLKLQRELKNIDKTNIDECVWHMANAIVNTYSGKPDAAIADIKILFEGCQSKMGTANTIEMLHLLTENYVNMKQYNAAVQTIENFTGKLTGELYTYATERFETNLRIYKAFASAPQQIIHKSNVKNIKLGRDKNKLRTISVSVNNKTHDFLFDTGSSTSLVTESLAAEFGVKLLEDSISTYGLNRVDTKLGYIEKLYLGDMLVENMIVSVLPDSLIYHGVPQGIIGMYLIRELKKFEISKNGDLSFDVSNNEIRNNMMICNTYPIVECISGKDTLTFYIDTGSNIC